MSSFPSSIWTGVSPSRDPSLAQLKAPDWRDWRRMLAEMSAVQNSRKGVDANTLHTIGAATSKTGLSVVETGDGAVHKSVLTFASMAVASTDGSTPGTDGAWGTQTLYTFPAGHIVVLGAHVVFPLAGLIAVTGGGTGLSTTADFEIGVGTVASAQAAGFGLGNGTQEDICTAMVAALTSKTSDAIESLAQAVQAVHDGSSSAVDIHLNYRTVDDADHGVTADVLTVNGTLTLIWANIGDD